MSTVDPIDRRHFLKNAAGVAAGAAALGAPTIAGAGQEAPHSPGVPPMSVVAETETPPELQPLTTARTGSDCMVDVIKTLNLEYFFSNPGSSFRALQESVINYGKNEKPEFITCCHEEQSVGMAHGYAKVSGKPAGVLAHGTVGLQHAAMAIYNAYCDRAPIYIVLGNTLDAPERRPGVEWSHSVQDAAAMVRDYTKWDDCPASLQHFAESAMRAYRVALTPPYGPVLLVADAGLQEHPVPDHYAVAIPRLTLSSPPAADVNAVAETARLLVAAENPVLIADRCVRTTAGMALLIQLAETLQCAVVDQGGRLNFPTRHPLNQSLARTIIRDADVIVGLEVSDFWGTVNSYRDQLHRSSRRIVKPTAKLVSISTRDLGIKGNYQDVQRYYDVDLAVAADAEATLPSLIEAVKRFMTADRRTALEARGKKLAEASAAAFERARTEAGYAWDASPISTARLSVELWNQIRSEDWALVNTGNVSGWPTKLWPFEKPCQHIGGSGGAGQGYGGPAAVGAALAHRAQGRLAINIQGDGDLMYCPGVLWTAAHHRIPLLTVMHNNRAYHQETMHLQRMANRHERDVDRALIGTEIDHPAIDFAKLAQSMGVYAEGPISDPNALGPALARAVAAVKKGEPALVDVVTEPR